MPRRELSHLTDEELAEARREAAELARAAASIELKLYREIVARREERAWPSS